MEVGKRVVITSANHPHYIGFGDLGWLWVRNFNDAHRFESLEDAQAFIAREIPSMSADVWYLKNLW